MFRTRIENWKLRRQADALLKSQAQALRGLKGEELRSAWAEWKAEKGWELDMISTTIQENETRELIAQAISLYLPIPSRAERDKWVEADDLGVGVAGSGMRLQILTYDAFSELHGAVIKQRRDNWEFRLKVAAIIITALTGLVGAAIGLVSVLKK